MTADDLHTFVAQVRAEADAALARLATVPAELPADLRERWEQSRRGWEEMRRLTDDDVVALHEAACLQAGRALMPDELRAVMGPSIYRSGTTLAPFHPGMPVCRLREWSLIRRFSRTQGGQREYLQGHVYGHDRWADGTLITTSAVIWRDGCAAMTASGHRYLLEQPRETLSSAIES